MKKHLFLLTIVINLGINLNAQSFQNLEANALQDDAMKSYSMLIENDKYLIYATQRVNNIFQEYANGFPRIYANDTVQFDLYRIDLATKEKKHLVFKKPSSDSLFDANTDCFFYDKHKRQLYVRLSVVDDVKFTNFNNIFNQLKNQLFYVIDSNFNVSTKFYHPYNPNELPIQANYLIENDTDIIYMTYDINNNYKPTLVKNKLSTNQNIATFSLPDSTFYIFDIRKIDTNSYIGLGNTAFYYLNSNLVLDSLKPFQTIFLPNVYPGQYENPFFYKGDTSFYYHTEQSYPFTVKDVSQIDAAKGRTGERLVLKKVNHDSLYNTTNFKTLQFDLSNFNMINKSYKYATCAIQGYSLDSNNAVCIFQLDSLNNLKWKKYFGFDAYYYNCNVFATKDSGCLIVANVRYFTQPYEQDLVYIKLDKNGNQETNYLPVSVNTFPEISKTDIEVYPNPFTETLTFKSVKQTNYQFIIYDVSGKKIVEKNIETNKTISINNLPLGTYFYTLLEKNKLIKGGIVEKK